MFFSWFDVDVKTVYEHFDLVPVGWEIEMMQMEMERKILHPSLSETY